MARRPGRWGDEDASGEPGQRALGGGGSRPRPRDLHGERPHLRAVDDRAAVRRGNLPDAALPRRAAQALARGARLDSAARAFPGQRRPEPVPGVHHGARRLDRDRQHRRRGDRDRVGRTGRAVLDLVLRLRRDRDQVRGGRARSALPPAGRRTPVGGTHAIPGARPRAEAPRLALRARGRRRGVHDHALHPAELDRGRAAERAGDPDARDGDRGGGADLAGGDRRGHARSAARRSGWPRPR